MGRKERKRQCKDLLTSNLSESAGRLNFTFPISITCVIRINIFKKDIYFLIYTAISAFTVHIKVFKRENCKTTK
jgi:hypothetical protein